MATKECVPFKDVVGATNAILKLVGRSEVVAGGNGAKFVGK
jgi:hypothetical protein